MLSSKKRKPKMKQKNLKNYVVEKSKIVNTK